MPPRQPQFLALWAWNARATTSALVEDIDAFASAGLDGVVIHPRFYPGPPAYLSDAYMEVVSSVTLRARELGLVVWIYDENGWPSGTADGKTLGHHPELAQQWLTLDQAPAAHLVSAVETPIGTRFANLRHGPGVDYLSSGLANAMLELIYEPYRDGLSAGAWDHVSGFFCDEPEFGLGHAYARLPPTGAIPWTTDLRDLFAERHAVDLYAEIPRLFFDVPGSAESRVRFWETLSDVFGERFLKPLTDWCAKESKLFTAHFKGEENPLFQVPTIGSLPQVARYVGVPGIDSLERRPNYSLHASQVVSTARQFGNGLSMAEVFGGAGWGSTPNDLLDHVAPLVELGFTHFFLHLSQHVLDSAALLDWPPSQPLHLTWKDAYSEVLEQLRAIEVLPAPTTLLVVPQRRIQEAYKPADLMGVSVHSGAALVQSTSSVLSDQVMAAVGALRGTHFDITDDRVFEDTSRSIGDCVQVGDAVYSNVVFVDDIALQRVPQDPPEGGPGLVSNGVAASWSFTEPPRNSLYLEMMPSPAGLWEIVDAHRLDTGTGLSLRVADVVSALLIDGVHVPFAVSRGLTTADLTPWSGRRFLLRYTTTAATPRSFAWIDGDFAVTSRGGFQEHGNFLVTERPFQLRERTSLSNELVGGGFPFLGEPISVTTNVELDSPADGFELVGLLADAVHVYVDDHSAGWYFPGKALTVDTLMGVGMHTITLRVVPNGFNHFGPHRYFRPDPEAVSPAQMLGHRNFADPGDAPKSTHGHTWFFRRQQLPSISIAQRVVSNSLGSRRPVGVGSRRSGSRSPRG